MFFPPSTLWAGEVAEAQRGRRGTPWGLTQLDRVRQNAQAQWYCLVSPSPPRSSGYLPREGPGRKRSGMRKAESGRRDGALSSLKPHRVEASVPTLPR